MTLPLAGVLDLTTVAFGPYASQIMGGQGAEIIKIEAWRATRHATPARHPGIAVMFLALVREAAYAGLKGFHDAGLCPPCLVARMFALIERGRLRAEQTVLVEGTGGVALFTLPIAKAHGAAVIVSGRADKRDHVPDIVGGPA